MQASKSEKATLFVKNTFCKNTEFIKNMISCGMYSYVSASEVEAVTQCDLSIMIGDELCMGNQFL